MSSFFQRAPLYVDLMQQQPILAGRDPSGRLVSRVAPGASEIVEDQRARALAPGQRVEDEYNSMAKMAERYRKRLEREANDRKETPTALTQQQWATMSPLQQAAAQANYDLSQAVLSDFKMKNDANDEQFERYQTRVKELFGENPGTGFKGVDYAPNTIAFLDKRGLQAVDLAGKNLDDLLSGDVLVDTETVMSLGKEVTTPDATGQRAKNIAFAERLAKGQLAFQEDLASKLKKGDKLLGDITTRATSAAANESYGGEAPAPHTPLTAVRPETVANFDMYMEALARSDSPLDKALEAINLDLQQRGASSQEKAQVYQGLVERSRQAMTGEGQWFPGIDFPMRSPLEVAQALGAPTLTRQAAEGVK
jgi:hypothetical protein